MRRRRNQGDTRLGVSQSGDFGRHLVAGKLTPFSWLGSLSHLDLKFLRRVQIGGSDPETPRRHLFDRGVAGGAEPVWILSTFTRVGTTPDQVHRLGQSLVSLPRKRSV